MNNLFYLSLIICFFGMAATKKGKYYLIETEDGPPKKHRGKKGQDFQIRIGPEWDYSLKGPEEEEGPEPYDVGKMKPGPKKHAFLENAIDGGSLNENENGGPEPYAEDKKTLGTKENVFEGGSMSDEKDWIEIIEDEDGPESNAEKTPKKHKTNNAFEGDSHKRFEQKSFHHNTENELDGGSIMKEDAGPEPYAEDTTKSLATEVVFEGGSMNEKEEDGPEPYAEDTTKKLGNENPFEGGAMYEEEEGPDAYAKH